jgi:hypothetical protein
MGPEVRSGGYRVFRPDRHKTNNTVVKVVDLPFGTICERFHIDAFQEKVELIDC